MKFKDFKAGDWVQQYQYKSFSPIPVNREWNWENPVINTLLEAEPPSLHKKSHM